jgi:hypothetical protein
MDAAINLCIHLYMNAFTERYVAGYDGLNSKVPIYTVTHLFINTVTNI